MREIRRKGEKERGREEGTNQDECCRFRSESNSKQLSDVQMVHFAAWRNKVSSQTQKSKQQTNHY